MPNSDAIDDLLGSSSLDDLLAPARKRKKRKAKPAKAKAGAYTPLEEPVVPEPGGIWVRRKAKGKNLGRTCLVCNEELKYRKGRPPVVCRKAKCFRAYRNMYRKDYDAVRA